MSPTFIDHNKKTLEEHGLIELMPFKNEKSVSRKQGSSTTRRESSFKHSQSTEHSIAQIQPIEFENH